MTQDGHGPHYEQRDEHLDQDLDELSSPPSNKKLLCIAFVSFQSFATIQIFVALYAGSEAMLGDSVAMMVDALTYLFNLIAERQKEIYASKLKQQNNFAAPATALARSRMVLQYRKYTYQLELIPPLISVSILLIVTVLVMKESIHTLILDTQRDASLQSDPNINLMVIFSFFNLLLDMLNVGCFASASHAFGYKTNNHTDSNAIRATPADTTSGAISDTFEDENLGIDNATDDYDLDESEEGEPIEKDTIDLEDDAPFSEYQDINDRFNSSADKDGDSTNLNMCSAYTVSASSHLGHSGEEKLFISPKITLFFILLSDVSMFLLIP